MRFQAFNATRLFNAYSNAIPPSLKDALAVDFDPFHGDEDVHMKFTALGKLRLGIEGMFCAEGKMNAEHPLVGADIA